ncbi:MAG: NUDIX domain-containing protein [Rothia sp. (in: high G+C Gram-positive bacteria)]|nr:NUDIX domain-containing protein [Rothia sp. (in: high G+C Gram-positive bacteria)]
MIRTMQTRPAAYVLLIEQGAVLLSHFTSRSAQGQQVSGWILPGGGIEPGEQPAQAAVREVREETGFEVELEGILGVQAAYYRDGAAGLFCALRTIYRGHILGGHLCCEQDGSTDEVRWVPLADLAAYRAAPVDQDGLSFLDAVAGMLGESSVAAWAQTATGRGRQS